MVLDRASGRVTHRTFRDLSELLRPGDGLVLNKTRVMPARFSARRRTGGRLSGLFLGEPAPGRWSVLLTGAARLRSGEALTLDGGPWTLTLCARGERGQCDCRLDPPGAAGDVLSRIGRAPLPPYIRRSPDADPATDRDDLRRYQTVYARTPGAVAAPTAGMHFTAALLDRLRDRGVTTAELVLHVGLGTFAPVETDDLADHPMHREWYDLPGAAVETIARTRAAGGRVVAVGTTTVRVLETCHREGRLHAATGWTDLLIQPPYAFGATGALLTNFHLPGSTLLALVFAFAGRAAILRAYREAIQRGYRFYSYGDAMLIV